MLTINYCYTGMCFLERYGRSRGEKKEGQGWSSSSAWPLYYEGQQTATVVLGRTKEAFKLNEFKGSYSTLNGNSAFNSAVSLWLLEGPQAVQ
jgi:hypothetical protein